MNSHSRFDPPSRLIPQPRREEQGKPLARTIDSQSLFRGLHEIGIEHAGALYRLKITRQGKLILNK